MRTGLEVVLVVGHNLQRRDAIVAAFCAEYGTCWRWTESAEGLRLSQAACIGDYRWGGGRDENLDAVMEALIVSANGAPCSVVISVEDF